jgi:hypothetical protein
MAEAPKPEAPKPERPKVPPKPREPGKKPVRSQFKTDELFLKALKSWQDYYDKYTKDLSPTYIAALKAQQDFDAAAVPPRTKEEKKTDDDKSAPADAPEEKKPAAKPTGPTIYDLNGNPIVPAAQPKVSSTWPAQSVALIRGIADYNAPPRAKLTDAELHRKAIDREITDAAVSARMKSHMGEDAAYKTKFMADLEQGGQRATQQGFNQEVMRQFPAAFAAVPPPRAIYNPVRAAQTMPQPQTFAPRPLPTPEAALAAYAPRPQPTEEEMMARYAPKDQATEEELLKRYALLDSLKGR